MNNYTRKNVRNRKRRIERRLGDRNWKDQAKPMLSARNIRYEMGDRMRGLSVGGIGMMHQVARRGEDALCEASLRIGFISLDGRPRRQPRAWRAAFETFMTTPKNDRDDQVSGN